MSPPLGFLILGKFFVLGGNWQILLSIHRLSYKVEDKQRDDAVHRPETMIPENWESAQIKLM